VDTAKSSALPIIVSPLHDPGGILFKHIQASTPDLKQLFLRVHLSVTPATEQKQPGYVDWAKSDPFFDVNFNQPDTLPGDHYLTGYRFAVENNPADQIFHLCDLDRAAYSLNTEHREAFVADVQWATEIAKKQPVLFQRSNQAWGTYPENYRQIEHMLIKVGEMLFDDYFEFAWSYIVMRVDQLADLLPNIKSHDFGLLIEIILMLREILAKKKVDWLSWEDPYILGRDADELRQERESSQIETKKRLRGVLPFFEHFLSVTGHLSVEHGWEKPTEHTP